MPTREVVSYQSRANLRICKKKSEAAQATHGFLNTCLLLAIGSRGEASSEAATPFEREVHKVLFCYEFWSLFALSISTILERDALVCAIPDIMNILIS